MIVLDENLPPALASFLEALGEPARHVRALGLAATSDERILEQLSAGEDCLLTRDRAMLRRPHVVALLHQCRLGLFILPSRIQLALESSELVLRHWSHMLHIAKMEPRPFVGILSLRGPLSLDRKFGR